MKIKSKSSANTKKTASDLAKRLQPGAVLALYGELGVGKTCFIQGFAEGLCITEPVVSPSYTIIREYEGTHKLNHIDLYRIHCPEEISELGLEEYIFDKGITAIEWAERAEWLLPPKTVRVSIKACSITNERLIVIEDENIST